MRSWIALLLVCACKTPDAVSTVVVDAAPSTAPSVSVAPSAAVQLDASRASQTFGFDGDDKNALPVGFSASRTGGNRDGKWVVRAEADSPSMPNVVEQIDNDPSDSRFALLTLNEPSPANVSVSVRCKPVAGVADRACGVVCRLQAPGDYYLARANALEDNVRFYVVQAGVRKQLASWNGKVTSDAWHKLGLVCSGDSFTVSWDGNKVLTQHDKTIATSGKIGLWTKADSVTYFDDLMVSPP
jgi:hypothetical protein